MLILAIFHLVAKKHNLTASIVIELQEHASRVARPANDNKYQVGGKRHFYAEYGIEMSFTLVHYKNSYIVQSVV